MSASLARMAPDRREIFRERLAEWRDDFPRMVRELFHAEPDKWQDKVLAAFRDHHFLALKACKGPGKTCLEAWLALGFLLTRENAEIIVTAVTKPNLKDNLWKELSLWHARAPLLQRLFDIRGERIVERDHPKTWWISARAYDQSADPAAQANTMAGLHAAHTLIVIDEVSECPDGLVVAAEGAHSVEGQEAKLVIAGNPTKTEGPLYRVCTDDRDRWWVMEITGDPEDPNRAPRISLDWAREQIASYGRDSNYVRTNVLGKFPLTASTKLLGPEAVAEAVLRSPKKSTWEWAPKVLGVDCARYGDDEISLFPRQGRVAFAPTVFREMGTMRLASEVALYIAKWGARVTFVDVGGVGGGVFDRLEQLGVPNVIGVEFGAKALEDKKYFNRRSEMWALMAEWVKDKGALPDDQVLRKELVGPNFDFDEHGRLRLETKKQMKKRGLTSPNRADGLALTFAAPVPVDEEQERRAGIWASERQHTAAKVDYDPFAKEVA